MAGTNKRAQEMSPLVMLAIVLAVTMVVLLFFTGGIGKIGKAFAGESKQVTGDAGGVVDVVSDPGLQKSLGGSPPVEYTADATSSPKGNCKVMLDKDCKIAITCTADSTLVTLTAGQSYTSTECGCKVTMKQCLAYAFKYTLQETK